MHAHARSIRLAPKKANIMAKMVRGKPVPEALYLLEHTTKKSARIIEKLLRSAMANAQHNLQQDPQTMVIKAIIVNQSVAYQRGVPMARGRVRPIKKFLCHISLQLGLPGDTDKSQKSKKSQKSQRNQDTTVESKASAKKTSSAKSETSKKNQKKSSSGSSASSDSTSSSK